jgi:hypothetical protein
VSEYRPASSFGWLDFDDAARDRVATMLRALDEPGMLDPLGLGGLRDAFSALLNPGTSTVHTKLRYFIFLPWIFTGIERDRIAPSAFTNTLKQREAELIECLRHLREGQGVIGYTKGAALQRWPSEIYWGGLGSWGLRRHDYTLGEYGQRAAAFGRLRQTLDDDQQPTASRNAMWVKLPEPPDNFLKEDIDFGLEPDEARLLIDQIGRRHPKSLLADVCARPALSAHAELPWELDQTLLGDYQRETLRHARWVYELTDGAQRLYNILLAREARTKFHRSSEDLEEAELERLDRWARRVAAQHQAASDWVADLPALWAFLEDAGQRVPERTRTFVTTILEAAVADAVGFGTDANVENTLRARESRLKSKRARLSNGAALENWDGGAAGVALDYRWPITRSYLADLAAALPEGV